MQIVVELTTEARQDLLRLIAARTPDEGDAVRFAALYADDIEAQFRKHEGPPPDAEARPGADGTVWWWRYANGIWTRFTLSDQPGWFFRPAVRTITVSAFRVRPPAP